MNKTLAMLITAGLTLVIIGVILSVGAEITDDVGNDMEENSTAWTAARNSTLAISSLAEWQGTIATVIAAVVIIGLLLAGFGAFLYFR